MKRFLVLLLIIGAGQCYSKDIRGAHIRTKRVSGQTYSITITLFTDASINNNRPTVPVSFGDGSTGTFALIGTSTGSGVNIKTYSGTHSYPGVGVFNVTYNDTFRVAGIKNMLNSQSQQIHAESLITINNWSISNTSPTISNYPFGFGVSGNQVLYNPGCYDSDSDSLSYLMVGCSGANYYCPVNAVISATSGIVSFSKDSIGLYAFSFQIKEWRKDADGQYVIIGTSTIDFVMDVTANVGVSEIAGEKIKSFAYPNPVKDEISISCNRSLSEKHVVEILNDFGQIVLKTKWSNKVNVSNLPKGLYFLQISDISGTSDIIRFIKD